MVSRERDVRGLGEVVDVLQWHYDHREVRPNFWLAASMVVLVQPSSGAAECVFSLLRALWGEKQFHTLGDAVKVSLMASTNKRVL